MLFDQNFQILTQTESAELPVESDARLLLFTNDIRQLNIAEAGASLPFKGHDQQWYLWGFYRLDSEHWLGIRESAARFAEVEKLPKIFGAIGLIGLAFTIFAGVWLASSITKPINQLVKFSRKLGEGDFTAKAPLVNPGELAILASAMDNMRQDLLHKNREKAPSELSPLVKSWEKEPLESSVGGEGDDEHPPVLDVVVTDVSVRAGAGGRGVLERLARRDRRTDQLAEHHR